MTVGLVSSTGLATEPLRRTRCPSCRGRPPVRMVTQTLTILRTACALLPADTPLQTIQCPRCSHIFPLTARDLLLAST